VIIGHFLAGHAAVHLVGGPAIGIPQGFSRRGSRAREHAAHHHEIGTKGQGFHDIAGSADAAVGHDGAVRPGAFLNGRELGHTEARLDARGADTARTDAHLHDVGMHRGQVVCPRVRGHIACHDALVGQHLAHALDHLPHVLGVAMSHIHAEILGARIPQRLDPLHFRFGGAHRDKGGVMAPLEHGYVFFDGGEAVEHANATAFADEIRHGIFGYGVHVGCHDRQPQREFAALVGHADVYDST